MAAWPIVSSSDEAGLNYARRQQYRRQLEAVKAAMLSGATVVMALTFASAGAMSVAAMLLVLALGQGLYARRRLSLAGRSRVGARSEDEVQRLLESLRAEGWWFRHSLPWAGPGDIDSVAIAPTEIAVVIETKCPELRQTPSRDCAGPGGVAVAPETIGVPPGAWRSLHCPRAWG
jgi:hypothetical protein